jgi:hypothetical protein
MQYEELPAMIVVIAAGIILAVCVMKLARTVFTAIALVLLLGAGMMWLFPPTPQPPGYTGLDPHADTCRPATGADISHLDGKQLASWYHLPVCNF